MKIDFKTALKEVFESYLYGMIFGLGLVVSGMCRPTKIMAFLTLRSSWDPTLLFVLLSAVAFNSISFRIVLKRDAPVHNDKFELSDPTANPDARLIIGSSLFGAGWGLTGLCPGPALINMFVLSHVFLYMLAVAFG